jgi:hypothetical protein
VPSELTTPCILPSHSHPPGFDDSTEEYTNPSMCKNIRTNQRYLCGCNEESVDLDLCGDYEQYGECPTPPEYWEDREPINLGSKRGKSKCGECKKKEEEENQKETQKEKNQRETQKEKQTSKES